MTGADFGNLEESGAKPAVQRLAYESDQKFFRIVALSLGVAISLSIRLFADRRPLRRIGSERYHRNRLRGCRRAGWRLHGIQEMTSPPIVA